MISQMMSYMMLWMMSQMMSCMISYMMLWMMSSMDKVQINIIILNNYISYGCCFDNFIQHVVHAYKLTYIFACHLI
jgi:hypothetical protein